VQAHADTFGFYQSITGAGNTAIRGDGGQGAHGIEGSTDYSYGVSGISLTGHAVHGESLNGGIGIIGISQGGIGTFGQGDVYGIRGESATTGVSGVASNIDAIGVQGQASFGIGVHGVGSQGGLFYGQSGLGVQAQSDTAAGVFGISSATYGGAFSGRLAALWLGHASVPGAPTTGAHQVGEVYLDNGATTWLCITSGTPGTWVRLTGVQSGTSGGAISYLSTPLRLLDARTSPGTAVVTRGPLAGNETYAFTVAGLGGSGIPGNAQGLIANLTVLGPSGVGNLSLFPAPGPGPSVASMTFGSPGLFLANGVNVGIGTGGAIDIQNQSSGTTPLVLDAVAFVS
jgi:hypothetical protein